MPSRAFLLVVLAVILFSGGCGTVVNLLDPTNGERKFGGIARDVQCAGDIADGGSVSAPSSLPSGGGSQGALGAALAALIVIGPFLDIPLSLIGDTLTYPLARWLDSP
jgi:uncharacterized protein YceK